MMVVTSIVKNGEETIFFEYNCVKAWAKLRNYRWHVQVKFFYHNGNQCGETLDFICRDREHVTQCFQTAKNVVDGRMGKCA